MLLFQTMVVAPHTQQCQLKTFSDPASSLHVLSSWLSFVSLPLNILTTGSVDPCDMTLSVPCRVSWLQPLPCELSLLKQYKQMSTLGNQLQGRVGKATTNGESRRTAELKRPWFKTSARSRHQHHPPRASSLCVQIQPSPTTF